MQLIGHRGAPLERPENTLSSFQRAIELRVDAIELDVHMTSDGVIVCHHDDEPAPSSAVPHTRPRPIREMSYLEVAGFSVDGEHIPTLEEAAALIGRRAMLHVELKGYGIERQVLEVMSAHRGSYALHSFDHEGIRRVRHLAPQLRTGILVERYLVDPGAALAAADATDLWPRWDYVDAELVRRVHRAGGTVIAWTVNSRAACRRLVDMGIDGICTDDIPAMSGVLRDRPQGGSETPRNSMTRSDT